MASFEWKRCHSIKVPSGLIDMENAQTVCLEDKVYIGGGKTKNRKDAAKLYIYTPANDTWDIKDTPVYYYALTVYHSRLVLVGGNAYVQSDENDKRKPSCKVFTLGEDGLWKTTLPHMPATSCIYASAVSHGDCLFVIDDSLQGVYIYNGQCWAEAQHTGPTFYRKSTETVPISNSVVIDGCWYAFLGRSEVYYAKLDSLVACSQLSEIQQSPSLWKRIPDIPNKSLFPVKFGNKLIAVGQSIVYAFSPISKYWVNMGDHNPSQHNHSYAVVLSSNELMLMVGSKVHKATLKGQNFVINMYMIEGTGSIEIAWSYRTRSNYPNILIARTAIYFVPNSPNMLDLEFAYTFDSTEWQCHVMSTATIIVTSTAEAQVQTSSLQSPVSTSLELIFVISAIHSNYSRTRRVRYFLCVLFNDEWPYYFWPFR